MRRSREGVVASNVIVAELRPQLAARYGMDVGGHRGDPLGERGVGLHEISQSVALLLDVATLLVGDPGDVVGRGLVGVGLPGLGEQDQRCGVRGLGGDRKIEHDERIRVPAQADRHRVERDPDNDEQGLAKNELRGPKDAGEAFRSLAEAVGPKGLRTWSDMR
jgi:hypothetical protein